MVLNFRVWGRLLMKLQKIAFGCDHAGFAFKEALKATVLRCGMNAIDFGTTSNDPVDYPDFAKAVAKALVAGKVEKGVLICGTGIGMSMSANRVTGVRAALCTNSEMAALSRLHNNANILVLGARVIDLAIAQDCLRAFLETRFEGGRHLLRVEKI